MNNQNNFNRATVPVNNRSKHNLGNEVVTSAPFGAIIPIYTTELIPGDTVYYDPSIYIRTPALQTATFGQVRVMQASFFVPIRTLWEDWEPFITGGLDGLQVYTKPYVTFRDLYYLCGLEDYDGYRLLELKDTVLTQTLDTVFQSMGWTYGDQNLYSRGYFSDLITNLGLNPYSGVSHSANVTYSNVSATPIMNEKLDVTPFRAYQKIWWDYFRDSVLIPEAQRNIYLDKSSGHQEFNFDQLAAVQDITGITDWREDYASSLDQVCTRFIAYKKDYFTTAKTNPQVGQAALIPVDIANSSLNPALTLDYARVLGADTTGKVGKLSSTNTSANYPTIDGNFIGNANNATSVIGQFQIEVFRTMNALQRYAEKNMIVGTRPVNLFLARYGYAPSASRYDMAELVGGDDRYLDFVQITSTADTASGTSGASLGDVSSYGRVFYQPNKQTYTAHEHGYFMSVLAIMPVVGYCDGIDRSWQRFSKEDYFTPEYENLGFQAIANKELFASGLQTSLVGGDPAGEMPSTIQNERWNSAFGFQERYSEYKFHRDTLGGDFVRYGTSVGGNAFHTFRRFNTIPSLNPSFIEVHPDQYGNNWNRLFVDMNDDYNPFYINISNKNNMVRPMSGFAVPALSNVYEQDGRNITLPYGGVRM